MYPLGTVYGWTGGVVCLQVRKLGAKSSPVRVGGVGRAQSGAGVGPGHHFKMHPPLPCGHFLVEG